MYNSFLQSYVNVTARSSTLPVPPDELKAHLGIVGTDDDARVDALQWSAIDFIERQTGRLLVPCTVVETFNFFATLWTYNGNNAYLSSLPIYPFLFMNTPTGLPWHFGERERMLLGRSPVNSITSLKYYDTTNTLQTLVQNTDFYFLSPDERSAFVQPVNVWPVPYYRPDAVQITYSAGYQTLPPAIGAAIKLLVGAWNENREDFNTGTIVYKVPIGVQALINSIKIMNWV